MNKIAISEHKLIILTDLPLLMYGLKIILFFYLFIIMAEKKVTATAGKDT
jgi:hypothetical protein